MSNTKVLNFSSSSSKATAFKSSALDSKLIKMPPQSTKVTSSVATTTPRMIRKTCIEKSLFGATNGNNLSPLRSPQLIRTKNWINSSTSTNNNKISSGSSSTCSDESIIPKYEQQTSSLTTSNYINTSQKRAYNFNKVTTTKKLLNSARNTAMVYEKVSTTTACTAHTNKININNNNNNNENHNHNVKFLSRNCEINKSFKSSKIVPNKFFKPTVPSNAYSQSSSSSSTTSSKSFSSKFPNGLPFENEFYHYRTAKLTTSTNSNNNMMIINNSKKTSNINNKNINAESMSSSSIRKTNRHNIRISRSVGSVASDKSSSLSNNSQNDFHESNDVDHMHMHHHHHHHNHHNDHDHMRESPTYFPTTYDSDVMYVDFTLKSVDKLKQIASQQQQRNCLKKPSLSAVKTTYYINDKNDNCFCEFESIKGTGTFKKIIDGKQELSNDSYNGNAIDKRHKDSVVYIALAW